MYEDFFGMRRGTVPCISISPYGVGTYRFGYDMYEVETSNPERVSGTCVNHNIIACM